MSFTFSKSVKFLDILQEISQSDSHETESSLLGGILSDVQHIWYTKGPCLEVRNIKSGLKVGGLTFGCLLRDSTTEIICAEELKSNGGLSLLVVALNCNIRGGVICLFNIFNSKIIRTIEIKEKISSLHIADPGLEVLNLPGPLRDFDGILVVGTEGGQVLLIDICRQLCEESINSSNLRNELNPSQLVLVTPRKISKLDYYRERAIRDGDHLAIFLNVVTNSQTEHFTLKGPKGEDRIHVNKEEVATSALYYCNQLTSLLVGFNFGAFQLWDLTSLTLTYTSPICEEHIPITHFALQEPTDDPKAFCYIWVAYNNTKLYQTGLPFAVMYSFCYDSKEYHDGYGYLYENFQSCTLRFQVELGPLDDRFGAPKGGYCLGLQPISKLPTSKDHSQLPATGDTLALCLVSWSVWYSKNNVQNYSFIFDLNQWYKEQMPNFTRWGNSSNFILKLNLSDLVSLPNHCLSCKLDPLSLRQFMAVQRLEEHFCPTSLTFDLWLLRENDIILLHNEGLQKFLLNQIQTSGPLSLIRPNEICHRIFTLGLTPLFVDVSNITSTSIDFQREVILNVALEHHLISWLYNCATEWAPGGFSSVGCSLDFLLNWAFQRAVVLKNNCDKYCAPLFDYSQSRLDHNTSKLLNSCIGQINILCKFYFYILSNLSEYISYIDLASEQRDSLQMVAVYFEVLQWLVNVGLLPESHPSSYPKPDISERISAPYPVKELTEYYIQKRAQLQLLSKERFASSDSLLFIDNLINYKCGAELLQKQWQEDEGTGLYPPPSLQSLLRTYLVPGASICHKHSLVIYLFLDLAMMLDQSQYSPVITYLIKFPAVFKVTSSIIKITQAFWHLDHGDYNTAIEQLLDPFVLNDDLHPWHHTIAMRSLLLQNQHNAALLYMEVRKPPILDDKDILTALSLYISNNMLSEAFYFLKRRCPDEEEKFLMHLFKECDKNESLHTLLYKCLNNSEEKAFLKYLSTAQNPSSNDLQIFYFLLRSRFLEAFDMHLNLRKKKPESQGLIGQRNASQTDQIVKIFKTLLPDVNSNLVEYIQKERTNLWKEVPKPTPLSVFIHNTREQVRYKSTVIHAAISKAKDTFDSINISKSNEVETEDTPFLRTPTAFKQKIRRETLVITPKVIELDENGDELSPSPPKRLKLSPRAPTTSPSLKRSPSLHSQMLTPVVKRKPSPTQDYPNKSGHLDICTPQSILKVRNLVMYNDSRMEETLDDNDYSKMRNSPRRISGFGLLPRRSLSRAAQHVQFKDVGFLSSSLSDISTKQTDTSNFDEQLQSKSLSSRDISLIVSSKDSSTSHDDVFYSPDTSTNDNQSEEVVKDKFTESSDPDNRLSENRESLQEVDDVEMKDESKAEIKISEEQVVLSPRARRSYKRSFGEITSSRFSPRLARKIIQKEPLEEMPDTANNLNNGNSDYEKIETKIESPNQSPRLVQKVKSRRSLSRQVLEHNTFSKMHPPTPLETNVSKEISLEQTDKIVVSEKTSNTSTVTTVESHLDIKDVSVSGTPVSTRQHVTSSSFSKSRLSQVTLGSETSTLSEYSFAYEPVPDLMIPDIVLEYLKQEPPAENTHETKDILPSNEDEKSAEMKNEEEEEEKMQVDEKDKMEEEIVPEEKLINPILKEDEYSRDKILSEVYEDLSSGSEDIAEVLNAAKNVQASNIAGTKMSEADSFRSDNYYLPDSEVAFLVDESKNDALSSGSEDAAEGLNSTSSAAGRKLSEVAGPKKSSSSSIPEAEKAFLADDKSVIVISSEEEASTSSSSDNSASGNETDDLNVSYEHNIHIEENSRSLIDSEYSQTTEASSVDFEAEEGMAQVDAEEVDVEDVNEDDDPAAWMNDNTRSSAGSGEAVGEEMGREIEEEGEVHREIEEEAEVVMIEDEVSRDTEHAVRNDEQENINVQSEENQDNVESNVEIVDVQNYLVQDHSPVESNDMFLMEQTNYLQSIPIEDQQLVGEALIKEFTTVQGISSSSDTNYEDHITLEHQVEDQVIVKDRESEPAKEEVKEISNVKDQSTNTTNIVVEITPSTDTMEEEKEVKCTEVSNLKDESTNTTNIKEDSTFVDVCEKEVNTEEHKEPITIENQSTSTTNIVEEITQSANIVEEEKEVKCKEVSNLKDESTNTTNIKEDVYGKEANTEECKEPITIENQSTNTTLFTDAEENKTLVNIPDDSPLVPTVKEQTNDIEKSTESVSVSKTADDQNTSSSDATEEEVVKQHITVTAQVHTPNREETVKEKSQQGDLNVQGSIVDFSAKSIDLATTTQPEDTLLPGVRTRRTLSLSSVPVGGKSVKSRTTTRSLSINLENIDCNPSSSKETIENPVVKTLMRRTRSVSIDHVKTYARRSSVDETVSAEPAPRKYVRAKGKSQSVVNLPIVKEENLPKSQRRAESTFEEYTSTRRLTRRQAGMLKNIPPPSSHTFEDDSEEEMRTEDDFDPIKLLDKDSFEGKPDPEEKKIYEESSPSTSTSSFVKPGRRLSRSASVASDSSLTPSNNRTPPKKKSTKKTESEVGTPEGVRTRSRKQSDASSVVSERSDSSTPPKRARSKRGSSVEVESVASGASTSTRRTRASTKSESSNSPRKSARRRIVSTKSDLPEITEEKTSEAAQNIEKKSRKRKKSH